MTGQVFPTGLFSLICISFIFSIVIFTLAPLNFGTLSVWIEAASAMLTMVYHVTIAVIAYRRRVQCPSTYLAIAHSTSSIAWAFFLLAMWFIAFGITTQLTFNGPGSIAPSEQHGPWHFGVQVAESVFTVMEAFIMGAIAIRCTIMKNSSDVEAQACIDAKEYDGSLSRSLSTKSQSETSEPSDSKFSSPPSGTI